jgi:hypothetical protein
MCTHLRFTASVCGRHAPDSPFSSILPQLRFKLNRTFHRLSTECLLQVQTPIYESLFISYHQGFQFTSISTSLLASGAYLIWVPSTVFMRLRSSTALGSIINGSWINFTKKDDHFSISTLFSSLKDILHSMVNVSILFRIVLTSNQPCL